MPQENQTPTFHGQPADKGTIVIGKIYPDEGFASLTCGNTEVKIGYTVLHHLQLHIDPHSSVAADLSELQKAIHSITCEAGLGRSGDAKP